MASIEDLFRDDLYLTKVDAYKKLLDRVVDVLIEHRQRVLKELRKERKTIDTQFWIVEEGDWLIALGIIELMAVESATISIGGVGVEVTGDLVAEAAHRWAGEHAGKLVKGIVETTRKKVAAATQTFIDTPGMTQGQLIELVDIDSLFGYSRAKNIAMTEVTNAYMQGAEIAKEQIERMSGLQMVHIWNTNNDALVCDECASRNGRKQGDGWWDLGAIHPGCRCWTTMEIA